MLETTSIVTGGAGFLGSNLVRALLAAGQRVVAIDNFATVRRDNMATLQKEFSRDRLIFVEGDATSSWSELLGGIDSNCWKDLKWVFHFASPASPKFYQKLPLETLWVNSKGLSEAIGFADLHSARLIFASTSEVYGDPTASPQPETYWGHVNSFGERSCYDEAKRFGEALIFTSNKLNGSHHGLVRIFNTYGPGMNLNDGRVIINFMVQALNGEPLTIYGQGQQSRSFCYVDDLIEGVLRYAQSALQEPVNLGHDSEFTMLELVEEMRLLFADRKLNVKFEPLPHDDPTHRCPDLKKAEIFLKWKPKISLKEGLRKMLPWVESSKI
jgi:nucleoside-diphosphate-sugar epimerase